MTVLAPNIQGTTRSPQVVRQYANNGAGACIVPGVAVGDIVLGVYNIKTIGSESSSFETVVTVANQVRQSSASNLSANEYFFITMPQS